MKPNPQQISILGLALVLAGAAVPAAAAGPWQLRVSGVSAQPTSSGAPNSSLGGSLGLEYRASQRIGVEVEVLPADFVDEQRLESFGGEVVTRSDFRMTPILARLDVHLTPGRRADLYFGPVAGYVSMSGVTERFSILVPGVLETTITGELRFPVEDQFTWGAHVGLDIRLGGGNSFLTAGATYLDLPLKIAIPPTSPAQDDDTIGSGRVTGDLDPLVFQLGYSYRF